MNIKDYLKNLIEESGVDFWDLPYELSVENWPEVKESEDDEDEDYEGDYEPLDCENFEWLSIEDDELIIACGGDWQEPKTLTIKMIDDVLTVVNVEDGFSQGMSEDEFCDALGLDYDDDEDDEF